MRYNISIQKRAFDVVIATLILLLLSPLFLIVIIAIRLESKGPVFYYQPRVGTGYKIFPFFKFRSMYVNADKRVAQMKDQSQYALNNSDAGQTKIIPDETPDGDNVRVSDLKIISESEFSHSKENDIEQAFFKVKNDPRITKVGRIIERPASMNCHS